MSIWAGRRLAALRTLKQDEPDYASSGKIASVESLFAHIFREPSGTKHPPLLTVPFESRLESITEEANDDGRWLSVRLPDDRHGWIRRGDITFDVQAVTIPEVIRLAKRFLGLPYTWGGTTSYGYDCSGYTQMLCRRAGVNLPRDAAPQFHWQGMKPVERTDILPGDLIFFGRNKEKPSHVGMYIGDGEFIHTSAWEHPVLQVSRLSEEHWTRLYIGARRWKP